MMQQWADYLDRLKEGAKVIPINKGAWYVAHLGKWSAYTVPAGDMAEYQPKTEGLGNLVGICPQCEAMMYWRVSLAKLPQVRGNGQNTNYQQNIVPKPGVWSDCCELAILPVQ